MATPTLGAVIKGLAERTAMGVRKMRVTSTSEAGAVVQAGRDVELAGTTTDEPLRAGDQVWVQPTKPEGRLVIHGKAS
jgi:archaeosine-15-forming tRNA-guanine transglycosylase